MTLRLGGRSLPVVGTARMYVCGITPYDTTHVGHAATFVWTDLVARVLRNAGLDVQLCRNITDVDDDMLEQARVQGVNWRSLATRQTYRFEEDMRLLGVDPPEFEPQSHNYVDEVIALAAALLESKTAYERDGGVYFRGADVPGRVGVSRHRALAVAHEQRGPLDDSLRDEPLDVPVWQPSLEHEPAWPSPWGDGRPGWHAECAAMTLATLGASVDVHGGGADLAFPHHAYEAAMAEAATGVAPFARSWLHVGTVRIGGEKMAKSTGNLVFVHDVLESYPPQALRLLVLDRTWYEPWDYREQDLDAAAARHDDIRAAAGRKTSDDAAREEALAALRDDLDVPRALAIAEDAGGGALHAVAEVIGLF